MATENLDELMNRRSRLATATWGPNYLEGPTPNYYWQPETLCYFDVETGREVWVLVRGRDDRGDVYSPEYASEAFSYDGSMLGFQAYRFYPTVATLRRTTNNASGTSQILRWIVRTDGSKLRYANGMGDVLKCDGGFGWANTENAYYCFGDGTHSAGVEDLTKNTVNSTTLAVTSAVVLDTSSAAGGDASKGLSNVSKTYAKRPISNDDNYYVCHTRFPDLYGRSIPTQGFMRIALNKGVGSSISQYWGLSRNLHNYTFHDNPISTNSAWSAVTTYSLGQRAVDTGLTYQSVIASNTNNDPSSNPSKWFLIDPGAPAAWSAVTNYFAKGLVASYLGSNYISIATGTNHLPTDVSFWQPLVGGYSETQIHSGANVHLGATLDRMWVQHATITVFDPFWIYQLSGTDADGGPIWQDWNGSSYGLNEIIPFGTVPGYGNTPEGFLQKYPGHPTPDRWSQYYLWGYSDTPNSGTTVSLIDSPGTGFDGGAGVITTDIASGFNPDGHHHAWNAWSDYVVFFPNNINGIPNTVGGASAIIMYTRKVDVVNGTLGTPIQLCNPQTGNPVNYEALARPIQSPDGTKVAFSSYFLNTDENSPYICYVVAQYPYPPNISGVTKSGANVRLTFAPTPYTNRKSNGDGTGSTINPSEIKGWHVWQSPNGTDTWTEITTTAVAFASTTYDISQSNGTTRYYAMTAEENSGLESRRLSNIWRAVLDGGGALTATQTQSYPSDPGSANNSAGQSTFFTTKPPAPTGVTGVYTGAAPGHVRVNWTEPSDSKIRYYNIYYGHGSPPLLTQPYRIASIPVGYSTYLDWNADETEAQYRITSVDRQGNESDLEAPVSPPSILSPLFSGLSYVGTITIGADSPASGVSLIDAFPNIPISGAVVATIIFCTHENNSAGGVIYIGDLTMTNSPSTTASISLLGPNVIDMSMSNPKGMNTIPLGNVKINASAAGLAVRISVLIT